MAKRRTGNVQADADHSWPCATVEKHGPFLDHDLLGAIPSALVQGLGAL